MAEQKSGEAPTRRFLTVRAQLVVSFLIVLSVPLVVSLALADLPGSIFLAITGATVLLAIPLAVMLSAEIARPIAEVRRLAQRVASGELGAQAEVVGGGEVAELARAVNTLSAALRQKITDADASRDEVRRSVRRLGEALRATHDLGKMLSVVLETALVAVEGRAGAVYLLTARRQELYVKVGRHLDDSVAKQRLALGHGLAGWVAASRWPAVFPAAAEAPVPADPEPVAGTALAVPLETGSQLVGVLAIYGRQRDVPFDQHDLETILSLARQAGVGIENVLLHQEAQRLSITDGLTGIWNYRYFQITLQRDVERAIRRPAQLALLVIDIDRFKKVNDELGHQRGDAVLIELAQRILNNTRHNVDFLARYGGEEFVLILPDTGVDGARVAAEKIREAVASAPFGDEGEDLLPITVSIGYAVHPLHALTPQELIESADQAMYEAKRRGRNQVVGADEVTGRRITLARDPAAP